MRPPQTGGGFRGRPKDPTDGWYSSAPIQVFHVLARERLRDFYWRPIGCNRVGPMRRLCQSRIWPWRGRRNRPRSLTSISSDLPRFAVCWRDRPRPAGGSQTRSILHTRQISRQTCPWPLGWYASKTSFVGRLSIATSSCATLDRVVVELL